MNDEKILKIFLENQLGQPKTLKEEIDFLKNK